MKEGISMNKKIVSLVLVSLLSFSVSAWAAEASGAAVPPPKAAGTAEQAGKSNPAAGTYLKDYQLLVEGKTLDTSDIPAPAIARKKETLVPLRKVADALGYTISWNPEKATAHMDMSIASMDFANGVNSYKREGKLKIINLDQTYTFTNAPIIIDGVTYVPARVFGVFFNDVSIADKTVKITVQKAELASASDAFEKASNPKAETASIANPMVEYPSLSAMNKKLGYTIPVPAFLKNKKTTALYLISDKTAQINYADGSVYRVEKGTGDISGDYTKYAYDTNWIEGSCKIHGRGEKDAYKNITWEDKVYTYAYTTPAALTKAEATKLALGKS
jgi:hypothetical protein